jgi:hypothetical protein
LNGQLPREAAARRAHRYRRPRRVSRLRTQPRHETFFTFFGKPGSNIVESVAILMAFAAVTHERWARLRQTPAQHRARRDTSLKSATVRGRWSWRGWKRNERGLRDELPRLDQRIEGI